MCGILYLTLLLASLLAPASKRTCTVAVQLSTEAQMSAVEPSYTHTEEEGGAHHVAKRQKGEKTKGGRNQVSH